MNYRPRCARCRAEGDARTFTPTCIACGGLVELEFDLARVTPQDSDDVFLRWRDLLPPAREGAGPSLPRTPCRDAPRLAARIGVDHLLLKVEGALPTGSTKDRMAKVAIDYLAACGVDRFAASSTGNSSTSFAHRLEAGGGPRMFLFSAEDFVDRVAHAAHDGVVHFGLRGATFVEAGKAAAEFAKRRGMTWERGFFDAGRREGLKMTFFEAVEQAPRPIDWYVQAVSSGMGARGVWKGAHELKALGVIDRVPRLLCVQQESCAPMVAAFRAGSASIRPEDIVARPTGIATAILRGDPREAYPWLRESVVDSGGAFVAVSEREIRDARRWLADDESIDACFNSAAALAGVARRVREDPSARRHTFLVNLTGADRKPDGSASHVHWLRRDGAGWTIEDPADERGAAEWSGAG